jgi:hypothetical protein
MKVLFASILLAMFYIAPANAVSKFDLTFNLGPSLTQGGNIQDIGNPNMNTGFGFNYFIVPNHGIGFTVNNEFDFDGSKKLPRIDDASITTFDLHYAYRYINGKFHIVFEPGFGWQTLYSNSGDYYAGYYYYDDLSTAFILDYKLFARYIVKEWENDDTSSTGTFFLGAGIIQTFSLNDDLYGKDISGNRFAMLFQVGVGW